METGDTVNESFDSIRLTIEASAKRCLEKFQESLIRASKIHARELSMVEDQMARFSSWATAMGVFAPGPTSMDHCLRHASDVRNAVCGLLESLNYRIIVCSDYLDTIRKDIETEPSSAQVDGLKNSFIHIATEISHLNKISSTIWRASNEPQRKISNNFEIKRRVFHVMAPLSFSTVERHVADRFPYASEIIQERLVGAMLLRRQVLRWSDRRGITVIQSLEKPSNSRIAMSAAQQIAPLVTAQSTQDAEDAVFPLFPTSSPSKVPMIAVLHTVSFGKALASMVLASPTYSLDHHEAHGSPSTSGLILERKSEQLKAQKVDEYNEPTDSSKVTLKDRFMEQTWEDHFNNDINLYLCVFEDCDKADVLFSHVDEWRKHMDQHGIFWRCPSHRSMGSFFTREDYMKHMREAHKNNLSDSQLRALANRNCRKTARLFAICPLCGKDEIAVQGTLENHILEHLGSLTLDSFSSDQEKITEDVKSGNVSAGASGAQIESTNLSRINEKGNPRLGTAGDILSSQASADPLESLSLYDACYRGLLKVSRNLLDKGASIDAQGRAYGNALQAASVANHQEIVQLLLERGADVNAEGGLYGSALQAASYEGYRKTTQLLLDWGADVNAQGGCYGNALQAASVGNHQEIVKVLLDRGANVNAQGGYYGSALQAASAGNHQETIQLLLDGGADVNAQGGVYGNALQAASAKSHQATAKILRDKGAYVKTHSGIHDKNLPAASQSNIMNSIGDSNLDFGAGQKDGQQPSFYHGPEHSKRSQEPKQHTAFRSKMQAFCAECGVFFENDTVLNKHRSHHHIRPYVCVFNYAGCESSFSRKEEWKRHVASQHLALQYWLCTEGSCAQITNSTISQNPSPSRSSANLTSPALPNGALFKHKDLYIQHVGRMHHDAFMSRLQKTSKISGPELDQNINTLLLQAERRLCDLPRYMRCPATGCEHEFYGPQAWDQRMEHVTHHLERAADGSEPMVSFGGDDDYTLTEWASSPEVYIVRRTKLPSKWELVNPINMEPGSIPEHVKLGKSSIDSTSLPNSFEGYDIS